MISRNKKAQSLFELAAALLVVTPIILLVIDCAFIGIGASLNASICYDSAKAAASGPPGRMQKGVNRSCAASDAPTQRALAVIKRVYFSNLPVKVRDDIKVLETIRDVPPEEMGGALDGETTVSTTMDVYPPFLVKAVAGPKIVLKAKQTMPMTYVRQPL